MINGDAHLEIGRQIALKLRRIRILRRYARRRRCLRGGPQLLRIAHRQAPCHNLTGKFRRVVFGDQTARMPRAQPSIDDHLLHILRKGEQTQHIGDMAAAFGQGLAEFVLRMPKPVHQLAITQGLFNCIQIRSLNVLDDRNLKNLCVVKLPHQNRDFMQLCPLCRPPAPFTGDNLEERRILRIRPYDQRLDDPFFCDGFAQFFQRVFGKMSPRLIRVRAHLLNR